MKHARELFWHYWLPLLAMLTLIKLESTDAMSGGNTVQIVRLVLLRMGMHLTNPQLESLNLVLRKCGHALGYGLLCLCWLLLLRGSYWLQHDYTRALQGQIHVRRMWWRPEWGFLAVLCTFLVAASDELHQMSIPSRTGTWRDVGLDTCAAMVVASLVYVKAAWSCRPSER